MSYKLAIFDYDGTLADSGAWMMRAMNRAAVKFGFRQVGDEEIEALRSKDNRAIIRELGVPMWRLPQMATYVRKLAEEEKVTTPLFPGVPEALMRLRAAGLKLAVVSSNTAPIIRRSLGPDLSGAIDFFACSASLFGKAGKFKRVVRLAGVAPAEAIAIGDETRDIEAARAAGLACGAVTWGYASAAALRARLPDIVFSAPDEIAEALAR